MDKILEINDVRKFFGRKEILRGINFSVEEGRNYQRIGGLPGAGNRRR